MGDLVIKRDLYLNRLIEAKDNSLIKVITGIRRCGKSFLLFELYYEYLLSIGIKKENILRVALDDRKNINLLNADNLESFIEEKTTNKNNYYIFLDEIQMVEGFEGVLNGLNKQKNLDIYVTGSNSRFLSSDILTEFRGRGDEIRVYPLSFREYVSVYPGSKEEAWKQYFTYGGLPQILSFSSVEKKSNYLSNLFEKVYIADIVDRNNLSKDEVLEAIINILASSVGSLTNTKKIADTFVSKGIKGVSNNTISSYINYLVDAFLIKKAERYDVKGKQYISIPVKYYFTDIGLRNARLNFRQQEENHIMENIIYNELLVRGFNVDVGMVEHQVVDENGKKIRKQLEVDFVCNQGSKRYYVQSAFAIPNNEKMEQEQNALVRIKDSFKKIIVVKDNINLWRNEQGIVIMGIQEFLLNPGSLDL